MKLPRCFSLRILSTWSSTSSSLGGRIGGGVSWVVNWSQGPVTTFSKDKTAATLTRWWGPLGGWYDETHSETTRTPYRYHLTFTIPRHGCRGAVVKTTQPHAHPSVFHLPLTGEGASSSSMITFVASQGYTTHDRR